MAYKSVTDSEKEVLSAYEAVKDRIVQAMLSAGMEEVPTVRGTDRPQTRRRGMTGRSTEGGEARGEDEEGVRRADRDEQG